MIQKTVAALAAVIAALAVVVNLGSSLLPEYVVDGAAGWAPQFGTMGQTALVYMYTAQAVGFGLGVLGVAALGYWAGRRLDVTREYRSLVGALAIGGFVGQLVGLLGAFAVLGGISVPQSIALSDVLFGVVPLAWNAVATGVQFGLIGLAGAALAEFGFDPLANRSGRSTGEKPTVADSAD